MDFGVIAKMFTNQNTKFTNKFICNHKNPSLKHTMENNKIGITLSISCSCVFQNLITPKMKKVYEQ